MVGLVGHSGSGQSTLVNLICRFYDVSEGSIKVDGVDLHPHQGGRLPAPHRPGAAGPFLFFGTIAENIAYGKPDATRAEIVAAARAAHAHEFILGCRTATTASWASAPGPLGGERQRISIARAL